MTEEVISYTFLADYDYDYDSDDKFLCQLNILK